MSLALTFSRSSCGIDAQLVSVETHLSSGLPGFTIVGLPEAAVKESRDRVRSAIINSHFEFPQRKITVNLAPADLPKEGSRFDLAIALGILAASGQVKKEPLERYEFIAELALSGELRHVRGLLPALIHRESTLRDVIVPAANHDEAALPTRAETFTAQHILEVCAHLNEQHQLIHVKKINAVPVAVPSLDISDVAGQPQAKRALEIAAAGGHNLLFSGPPGTGKTMLAARLASIMPPLNHGSAIEVAAIHSLAGDPPNAGNWRQRPFRNPHHTASAVAMVGGGSNPRPGEISLAHCGVLFLDEMAEFDRKVLEVLREPMESGKITISRAAQQVEFPARFQLIAAMNPCPCGFYGDSDRPCRCSPAQIERYRNKLSGPLLDRIDMHVNVQRLPTAMLTTTHNAAPGRGENSVAVRKRVLKAHQLQAVQRKKMNAALNTTELNDSRWFSPEAHNWLSQTIEKLAVSARSYHRLLRVARTIADLQQAKEGKADHHKVEISHVKEALVFRQSEGSR
jgi:magnesium chelatase family protein